VRNVSGVAIAAEQVIGAVERNEALRMLGGGKNVAGIVDADSVVGRRMEDQQRLVQCRDMPGEILLRDVVEERAADAEGAAGERDFDLAFAADLLVSRLFAFAFIPTRSFQSQEFLQKIFFETEPLSDGPASMARPGPLPASYPGGG